MATTASARKIAAVKAAAGDPEPFTFTHDGTAYTLPLASESLDEAPAGALIDAVMDGGDAAELKLGLIALKHAGASEKTWAALRSMTIAEFTKTIVAWLETSKAEAGK